MGPRASCHGFLSSPVMGIDVIGSATTAALFTKPLKHRNVLCRIDMVRRRNVMARAYRPGRSLRHLFTGSFVDAFWTKVMCGAPDECWRWTGKTKSGGHGYLHIQRQIALAHRVAYEIASGRIPHGLVVDHLCSNPICVNPSHLELVTNAENTRRTHARGRAAVRITSGLCANGHVIATRASGTRACRECHAKRCREFKARKKARESLHVVFG